MRKDHPDLQLTIEGHTHNVGGAEANQALSEKRAAAVRQVLIDGYQVDGARLVAKGLGQTKPAASNDTPKAGRATAGSSWSRAESASRELPASSHFRRRV